MKSNHLAENIRSLRNAQHWTQEQFAGIAGVDVRTVQRAEQGRNLAPDSLKAIAAAFNTTIDVLSSDPEEWAKQLAEFEKNHEIISLQPVESGLDLGAHLGEAHAYWLQRIGDFPEAQADALACFEQDLRDWMDVWSDLAPIQRRDGEKSLQKAFDELRALEINVSGASRKMRLHSGNGEPFEMTVLHMAVACGKPTTEFLIRDRREPIRFG